MLLFTRYNKVEILLRKHDAHLVYIRVTTFNFCFGRFVLIEKSTLIIFSYSGVSESILTGYQHIIASNICTKIAPVLAYEYRYLVPDDQPVRWTD